MKSFNLRQLKLRSGEQYRDEVELDLEPFELGGERYLPVPGTVPAELEITKAATGTVFRLATAHPESVRSLTAIEMGLAGFGLEGFADVTHGGSWHIGVLAAAGIPELLFPGRQRELLGEWAFPSTPVQLDGLGHYAALEAPEALSTAILDFLDTVDDAPGSLTA